MSIPGMDCSPRAGALPGAGPWVCPQAMLQTRKVTTKTTIRLRMASASPFSVGINPLVGELFLQEIQVTHDYRGNRWTVSKTLRSVWRCAYFLIHLAA